MPTGPRNVFKTECIENFSRHQTHCFIKYFFARINSIKFHHYFLRLLNNKFCSIKFKCMFYVSLFFTIINHRITCAIKHRIPRLISVIFLFQESNLWNEHEANTYFVLCKSISFKDHSSKDICKQYFWKDFCRLKLGIASFREVVWCQKYLWL